MAAYVLLGAASFVYAAVADGGYWSLLRVLTVIGWGALVFGLLLRRRWAWGLLLAFEMITFTYWLGEPIDWLQFLLQVILVLLLFSESMVLYLQARPLPDSRFEPPEDWASSFHRALFYATGLAGLVVASILALFRETSAVPLATLSIFWLLSRRRLDAVFRDPSRAETTG